MAEGDAIKGSAIFTGDELNTVHGLTRRDFVKYSAGTVACIYLGALNSGCGSSSGSHAAGQPIDSTVVTTTSRMLSFHNTMPTSPPSPGVMPSPPDSPNGGAGLSWIQLDQVSDYDRLGYGAWTFGAPLPIVQRFDIMPDPAAYATTAASLTRLRQFANFFAITDIHITDKEAPNQLIQIQQTNPGFSGNNTSIYSPVMMYTTHVLDAAIQTANALHKKKPFDFAISLGDTCNSTSYIELRWYIDVIDGKVITPSSGAHLGAATIDYQKPYKAAGLDKSIPWYQALGNHDHFMIGSFAVYAHPDLDLSDSYLSDSVWSVPNELLTPDFAAFPALFDVDDLKDPTSTKFYGGVIDGTTPLGAIIHTGEASQSTPPKVTADPNRRSLLRTEWIREYFNTSTAPVGHGFNLVNPTQQDGFACYSFLPKPDVPLKIIVLDDTQSENDGSVDIHGHGYLDANRWAWLQAELAAGQAADQLMIIAAHIPIAVVGIGGETEWWLGALADPSTTIHNAVNLTELVETLQNTPNLLMWMAGHRHLNTVKAFVSPDPANAPEKGFWQVETSSLRDFPQQFRTFEIYLNSDYTVSIVTTNVDPAVAEGTPAAKSRKYAIATQQIAQTNLTVNTPNYQTMYGTAYGPMDPTRPQGGDPDVPHSGDAYTDPSIQFVDLSGAARPVPYNASYNAELFKQLSPAMISALQAKYHADT
jgi:metallophosphoesterase (TIGR03768 family)